MFIFGDERDYNKDMSLQFGANAKTYNDASDVQKCIALYLVQMMKKRIPQRAKVYEIGAGTGHLTRQLVGLIGDGRYTVNDLSDEMLTVLWDELDMERAAVERQCADAETAEWPEGLDMIVSSSAVQWFKDPLNIVRRSAQQLLPGGILAFSTFLKGTYKELEHLGKGLDYPDVESWLRVLKNCGYSDIEINTEEQVMHFENVRDLLLSIKHTGVQGEGGGSTSYSLLRQLPLQLTYNILYVVARH